METLSASPTPQSKPWFLMGGFSSAGSLLILVLLGPARRGELSSRHCFPFPEGGASAVPHCTPPPPRPKSLVQSKCSMLSQDNASVLILHAMVSSFMSCYCSPPVTAYSLGCYLIHYCLPR